MRKGKGGTGKEERGKGKEEESYAVLFTGL
jgi:hypothetical protein